jgi:Ca-activated chloride channel family protein
MSSVSFAEPRFLWLLAGPAGLTVVWLWQLVGRHRSLRRLGAVRVVPVREDFRRAGELPFWLCVLTASALLILAMARPHVATAVPQRAGLDVIILQDASASMRVRDATTGDRWQRSMRFLRQLGDALSWHDDRLAMVAFAHLAAPQIRLTRDPNTLFFFLDHLHTQPPFRLEDDTTWDTNLEGAIAWGLRLVEKDEEINGRSRNGAVFLMLSDGESWSGEVARAMQRAVDRGIPLYVVGVGSLGGGPLPDVRLGNGERLASPGSSRLERSALQRIAAAGHGAYFELDRDDDRQIANTIVAAGRRLAPAVGLTDVAEDLHWWFVGAAMAIAALGLLCLQRVALAILFAGSLGTTLALGPVLW